MNLAPGIRAQTGTGGSTTPPPAAPVITDTALPEVTFQEAREDPVHTWTIMATNSPTSYGATELPAGTIFDANRGQVAYASNNMPPGRYNVTFTATNAAGTGSKVLTWDVHPRVISLDLNKRTGYLAGETLSITASFSGPVVVTGTPTITLLDAKPLLAGSTRIIANYASGSGTNTLFFTRVTTASDYSGATRDVIPSSISLNGGTILHSSGVVAVLNTPNPGPPGWPFTLGVVLPPPQITNTTAPTGTVGQPYLLTLAATPRAEEFQLRSGTLPDGLTLDAKSGQISGTPQQSGTFPITVGASNYGPAPDQYSSTATLQLSAAKPLTLTIAPAGPPAPTAAPVITNTALPVVTLARDREPVVFTWNLTATNSPTSYGATGLPPGTDFSERSGVLTYGVHVMPPGRYTVVFTATNAVGTGSKTLTWDVAPRVTWITPGKRNGYLAGETLSITVSFNAAVVVTGTPTLTVFPFEPLLPGSTRIVARYASGSGTDKLVFTRVTTVSDYSGATSETVPSHIDLNGGTILHASGVAAVLIPSADDVYFGSMLGVVLPPPQITTTTVPAGEVGRPYSFALTATPRAEAFQVRSGTLPDGLTLDPATGLISGTPRQSGTFSISVGASNYGPEPDVNTYRPNATLQPSAAQSLTMTIAPTSSGGTTPPPTTPPPPPTTPPITSAPPTAPPSPAPTIGAQTISFNSPVSAIMIGQPVTLGATSSAGLPITYSIVSGDAMLTGDVLTPRSTATLIVRASSAGSDTIAAASTDVNFGHPQKAGQSIMIAALNDTTTAAGPFNLPATTSAGLPITYAASGPARLEGGALVLTGAAGTVTLRATAAGNDSYADAAEVVRTFAVRSMGQQVYLGSSGTDTLAAAVSADNARGVLVSRLAGSGEAIVAKFTLNADGSFSTQASSSSNGSRTVNGRFSNGALTGSIAELGVQFTGSVRPAVGTTAAFAGLYVASLPGSASGEAYVVAGPTGEVYAVVVAPFGIVSGTGAIASSGQFTITAANGATCTGTIGAPDGSLRGTLHSGAATAALAGLSQAMERTDRLVNLSSRLRVGADDTARVMIAGFVVSGTEPKPMLIRAIGPSLSAFGVTDALPNPRLQIHNQTGALVAENDDWAGNSGVSTAAERVGAFRIEAASHDAAILATLPPGAYTAQVLTNGGTGVALVEVYDASTAGAAPNSTQVANISTRGFIDAGDGNLIAGFVVTGNMPKRVLIRGIGPSLSGFGVAGAVANPTLKLFATGSTAPLAQNDDWHVAQPINAAQGMATAAEIAATSTAVGAFPLVANSRDAAIVITLAPGAYTAVVSDANSAGGAGLVEVYQLGSP